MVVEEKKIIYTADDLFNLVNEYNPVALARVKKAYYYALKYHEGQLRKSGEPYIIHPLNVAYTAATCKADEATVCACLMHDLIEDTVVTYEQIALEFDAEIADLVLGVTNLTNFNFTSKRAEDIANLRKILISFTKDPRIVIIKIFDRLHNMRTLEYQMPEKQKAKAKETLGFYVPLIQYLGIHRFKEELEDLSFRYYSPEDYEALKQMRIRLISEVSQMMEKMLCNVKFALEIHDIPNDIIVRIKNIYGIYKEMMEGKVPSDIHDLLAFKVLVEEINDCYLTMRYIHRLFKPMNIKFKDFIAQPKNNMYQSLHTTVFAQDKLVQFRIKTYDMDRTNQYGLLSYWASKQGLAKEAMQNEVASNFQFIKNIAVMNDTYKDDEEFISHVSQELFSSKICVYMPNGQIIELPKNARVIDALYSLDVGLGDFAQSVTVNGEIASLNDVLHEYDRLQVILDRNNPAPKDDLNHEAVTTRARILLDSYEDRRR